MRKIIWLGLLSVATAGIMSHGGAQQSAPTVHEAMKNVVAVQAQTLWDVSNAALDDNGNPVASKLTAVQWSQIAQAADRLKSGAIALAGTDRLIVAAPGVKIQDEENPGAANAAKVQIYIDADPKDFADRARSLAQTADDFTAAAAAKDAAKLTDVAGRLDQVCESCHTKYWYPG